MKFVAWGMKTWLLGMKHHAQGIKCLVLGMKMRWVWNLPFTDKIWKTFAGYENKFKGYEKTNSKLWNNLYIVWNFLIKVSKQFARYKKKFKGMKKNSMKNISRVCNVFTRTWKPHFSENILVNCWSKWLRALQLEKGWRFEFARSRLRFGPRSFSKLLLSYTTPNLTSFQSLIV